MRPLLTLVLALAASPAFAQTRAEMAKAHRDMADAHKKMADCLASNRPAEDCRRELEDSYATMRGAYGMHGGRGMMGRGGMMGGPYRCPMWDDRNDSGATDQGDKAPAPKK